MDVIAAPLPMLTSEREPDEMPSQRRGTPQADKVLARQRVLDLGSGVGDIVMLATQIIGRSGTYHGPARLDESVERDAIRNAPNSGELLGHSVDDSCEIFSAAISAEAPERRTFGPEEFGEENGLGHVPSGGGH
jgi:hypothetical protein